MFMESPIDGPDGLTANSPRCLPAAAFMCEFSDFSVGETLAPCVVVLPEAGCLIQGNVILDVLITWWRSDSLNEAFTSMPITFVSINPSCFDVILSFSGFWHISHAMESTLNFNPLLLLEVVLLYLLPRQLCVLVAFR